MADCPFNIQVSAYHDGGLDETRRAAFARHLESCAACAAELARLAEISKLFEREADSPRLRLSPFSLHRAHRAVEREMDIGLLRIAKSICAVAAAVLVAATVGLLNNATPAPQPAQVAVGIPPWVEINAQTYDSGSIDASTPAAAWYLASASARDDTP